MKLSQKLTGTVFALRCLVRDHAAVWCDARRGRDQAVVATIEPDPGRIESQQVLAETRRQLVDMDRWEGHPDWYRRQGVPGPVLRIEGRSLRVAEHCQDDVDGVWSSPTDGFEPVDVVWSEG